MINELNSSSSGLQGHMDVLLCEHRLDERRGDAFVCLIVFDSLQEESKIEKNGNTRIDRLHVKKDENTLHLPNRTSNNHPFNHQISTINWPSG